MDRLFRVVTRGFWLVPVLSLVVSGCGGAEAPANDEAPATPAGDELPMEVLAALRVDYFSEDMETRYLDAAIDLNGDGQPERIVHVLGPMACGSGGCPTIIFTPAGVGHRVVTTISVSRPPVLASSDAMNGWRSLTVGVSGGGAEAGHALLEFDGTTYPSNPTVAPARPIDDISGADVVIADIQEFTDGTLLTGGALIGG